MQSPQKNLANKARNDMVRYIECSPIWEVITLKDEMFTKIRNQFQALSESWKYKY